MSSVQASHFLCARPVTQGPNHHFFGYYDKFAWDPTGRWLLGLETTFMDRPPEPNEPATIGIIDSAKDYAWTPLTTTRAWNWQQGCMLQWLGQGNEGNLIFNDYLDGQLVARILNLHTAAERVVDRPVYTVNRAGTHAVSLNFPRLHHQRPGYGYANVPDQWKDVGAPEDDGVYAMDLTSGQSRLIFSIAQAAAFQHRPEFDGKVHRFNHAQFGRRPDRFAVLHRNKPRELGPNGVGETRLLTMNLDGSDLCCLSDHEFVSHYDWYDSDSIVAWARQHGLGDHYYLFQDRGDGVKMIGEKVFTSDGHCSMSPDGQWMLTDTYPDETQHRTLMLYRWASGERIDIGRFYSPDMSQIRCDLHPRWSRDGRQICIDSTHEGTRQMYVLDVSKVVSKS